MYQPTADDMKKIRNLLDQGVAEGRQLLSREEVRVQLDPDGLRFIVSAHQKSGWRHYSMLELSHSPDDLIGIEYLKRVIVDEIDRRPVGEFGVFGGEIISRGGKSDA